MAASRVAETAALVGVAVIVHARGGPGAVAAFVVVATLGPAVGAPLITAGAARMLPGRGLAACLAVGAGGFAAAAAVVIADASTPLLLAAVGTSMVLLSSMRPLVTALLPGCIRSPQELAATNTAAAGVETVSAIVGPLAAAVVLALADPVQLLVGLAVMLLLAAAGTAGLRTGAPPVEATSRLATEVLEGVGAILRRGPIRLIAVLVGSQAFGRGAINVIAVSLAIDRLGMGDSGVGLLLGAIGVGGLIGLPIAARVAGAGRHGRTLLIGLVVWGLPLAATGLTIRDPLVLGLLAAAGLGSTLLDISADSLLQRLVPHGRLAPLLGSFESVVFATKAAGATAAGVLLAASGPTTAMVTIGVVPPLLAVLAARAARHLDDAMRTRDAGVALLQVNGIFSPLVLSAVDQLSAAATVEEHQPGQPILIEGDVGDRYYVIEQGQVEVVRAGAVVGELGAGDGFGEIALLDGAPRNATIVARTRTVTHSLDHDSFVAAMHADTRAGDAARQIADTRRPDTPDTDPTAAT